MHIRSFDADAEAASASSLPVPRGITFRHDGGGAAVAALAAGGAVLDGWHIQGVDGLPGWFEALPPPFPTVAGSPGALAADVPIPLPVFWTTLRALRATAGVGVVEPLLLIAAPVPATRAEAEAFAMALGPERFGLWGWPYDSTTREKIERESKSPDWHLKQLNLVPAWQFWKAQHPGREPGDGMVVGHPDTGYTQHVELTGRIQLPGRTFLRDSSGNATGDGLDDLGRVGGITLPQFPGHGSATASVIASDRQHRIQGVAPGAKVLPLRVSRSVLHLDLGVVGEAILHATATGADVISMSLGAAGYSERFRECIRKAQDQGVIVVAAAGNYVPATGFPAALPEVIAVAATNPADTPWQFSGMGRLVDIAAPGEQVWYAQAAALPASGIIPAGVDRGDGTSFSTACVAGLAALWLSLHGGRVAVGNHYGKLSLVPFAFQYALQRSAKTDFPWVRDGRHGAGIPNAEALLRAGLPPKAEVERFEQVIRAQRVNPLTFVAGLFSGGMGITEPIGPAPNVAATVDPDGNLCSGDPEETEVVRRSILEQEAEGKILRQLLGEDAEELAEELLARIAADRVLSTAFQRWHPGESLLPVLGRLLPVEKPAGGGAAALTLSPALLQRLEQQLAEEEARLQRIHRARLTPPRWKPGPTTPEGKRAEPGAPTPPPHRLLRAYAFDPSLETELDTATINQVTIPTPWEELAPGPVGEYLEVIDIDPASGCAYAPVDLDHPYVLAQDGLSPSEGSPQFHQQMVYAVAMNTISRFELALGRPLFWAPLRPWADAGTGGERQFTPEALRMTDTKNPADSLRDRYVQRLRIYPHALREANAFYSPGKRALLFGYFPAGDADTGKHFPGGMVFSCLSHDIIAHETTHAILDGMHPYFNEPSNEDVWAFHEAFADIMALFQHFTYPEVLRHQIARTRGDLQTENLLGQLAQEFGRATGGHGALRDALGKKNAQGKWERRPPDPHALKRMREPHGRGSILVAAVFDAFVALYNDRVSDLLRLYTGGTGILPAGRIHPDLVNRLALEAAHTAEEVLRICIRAMDYVPPVDITFGEFLRALITADYELAPTERHRTRIAFIDAFRSWGIYPRDVSSLSEESLRWRGPDPASPLMRLADLVGTQAAGDYTQFRDLMTALEKWQPGCSREEVFRHILNAQAELNTWLRNTQRSLKDEQLIPGLDLSRRFSVGNLRPARRIGMRGDFRTELVVEVVQTAPGQRLPRRSEVPFRGGATLIIDPRALDVRYVIYKRLYEDAPAADGQSPALANRSLRHVEFDERRRMGVQGESLAAWQGENSASTAEWLAATYACRARKSARRKPGAQAEPFALLHRTSGS